MQFSLHGPEWPAITASKGAPVKIVANCVIGAALWIAMTPDFKFNSIKDLKRETIVTVDMVPVWRLHAMPKHPK